MNYSDAELQAEIARMSGEGFLFAIFPSESVRTNMESGGVKASRAEVERLWTAYQKGAIEAGIPPYSKGAGGANAAAWLQFLERETGYPRMTIAAWLNGLEKAVKEQGWDWKWLDPAAAREAGVPISAGESVSQAVQKSGQAIGDFLKPGLDPVTNLVKYAALAMAAGAVIYGVYHGSRLLKSRRRG